MSDPAIPFNMILTAGRRRYQQYYQQVVNNMPFAGFAHMDKKYGKSIKNSCLPVYCTGDTPFY